MRRNKILLFTRVLYALYIIGAIITFLIIHKDIGGTITYNFVTSYVLFTFFMLVYIPLITIINARKLKWSEIRTRILKFSFLFVLIGALNYIIYYLFMPERLELYRIFLNALGLSFGISFIDIIFFNNRDN